MITLSDNTRGALLMTAAMAAFTVNDAFMKAALVEASLMQAIFLRGVVVVPLMILLCRMLGHMRPTLPRRDWHLIAIRTVAEMLGALFFISALMHLPLANVSAILQALPLTVSLAAALVFREPLGWRRMTAILIGFVGVLLIVRPGGADFNIFSLLAVATVLVVTVRDLAARRMSPTVPSTFVGLASGVGVLAMAAVGLLFDRWEPLGTMSVLQIAGAAVFIIAGYVFSVSAMRVGEISAVAPFRYTSLLVALILGFVMFGEVPQLLTWIGAAIVVATGLFTLYRERALRLRQRPVPGARNAPGV